MSTQDQSKAGTKKTKRTRSKLGRGLSALVDQSPTLAVAPAVTQAPSIKDPQPAQADRSAGDGQASDLESVANQVIELDVTNIVPNKNQPRRVFEESALEELAESIQIHGLMQPVVVRRSSDEEGLYELIAGERRWRASCRTGNTQIRAIVMDVDDLGSAQLALIENIQREDLNPIERAKGFLSLSARFSMTQDQIAKQVGISRSSVANQLRLLDLDDEIIEMIASRHLGTGHGKVLLSCENEGYRLKLARLAAEKNWTVRALEEAVGQFNNSDTGNISDTNLSSGETDESTQTRMESVLQDLEKRLGEHLSTKVKLKTDRSGTKGSITIDFFDLDHFDGLMNRLGIHESDDPRTRSFNNEN